MCLSYHVVGACPPSCMRVADHRKHVAKETAQFVTYLAPELRASKRRPPEEARTLCRKHRVWAAPDRRLHILRCQSIHHSNGPNSLQFGNALLCILQYLHCADTRCGPIYIAKVDITDAFMRIQLYVLHIPMLGALLPSYPGETPLVAFPMILPMGWVESPHLFVPLLRPSLTQKPSLLHRLEHLIDSHPTPILTIQDKIGVSTSLPAPTVCSCGPFQAPLNVVKVYMDDFILLSQLSLVERVTTHRVIFKCIDSVIQPLTPGDNPRQKEPNSVKTLAQGDAHWSQRKAVLGWLIDTKARTIELLPHHRA
jgi:hypothetical protein